MVSSGSSPGAAAGIRRLLLALLLVGLVFIGTDLYLLAHFEDLNQFVPFVVIGLSLVSVAWHLVHGGAASVRALQVSMLLMVVAGLVGAYLHFQGNMEFQVDIDPSLSGWALFNKVMHAKAPPAMAPGAMAQIGLVGLIYSYRHPALTKESSTPA